MTWTRRRFVTTALACSAPVAAARAAPGDTPQPQPLALVAATRNGAPGLSYDGTAGGPVVRIRRGTPLAVSLRNALDKPTSLQWHGLRGPNATDGDIPLTAQPLAVGATTQFTLTPPDSGLFWFHPAALAGLPDQTAAGLRGVLVVEEDEPPAVDRDLLLTLDAAGDTATVNASPAPLRDILPPGGRLRLRLVNASTSRIMILAVDGTRPKIVAIDGQPSDLFEPVRDSVPIGPGARFELMMDAPRDVGAAIRLTLRGVTIGEGPRRPDTLLMELTTKGAAVEARPPIAALPRNPALPPAIPLERSVRADLAMEPVAGPPVRWRLNGVASLDLPAKPLLTVPRGGVVTLGFDNRSTGPVPIRVHGHAMRLLHAKDDGWEPYWRDSVILPPTSINHVAFVADNPGKWLVESAMYEQAAFGLRSWFEVT